MHGRFHQHCSRTLGNRVTAEFVSDAQAVFANEHLFKCAVCGELVYESQLDNHVLMCPDPCEPGVQGTMPAGTDPQVDVSRPRTSLSIPVVTTIKEDDEQIDCTGNDAEEESLTSSQPFWKQWKDSDLAQHHEVQDRRSTIRRSQMVEELKRKEEEECTFQPKILQRGSPRICSRLADGSTESSWLHHCEQSMRSKRLKQVEAQAYADVTLRPKISRFAQIWSQRQHESLGEGQQVPTVFERLYNIASQTVTASAIVAASTGSATAGGAVAVASSGDENPNNSNAVGISGTKSHSESTRTSHSSPRRITNKRGSNSSELLYNDAIDRQQRLTHLANEIKSREESAQDRQVLDRSRRYFW